MSTNTYECFYRGRRVTVYAATTLSAQQGAATHFGASQRRPVKQHEITVMLVEKDGQPYTHSTAEL